ncbi:MAG TPA: TadE/TadG family type IV pilus assembly protein [Croceibacterium sp.]|nr:TadE/TadG family type IV pilus assembly protein [Croceibacterium sp.]
MREHETHFLKRFIKRLLGEKSGNAVMLVAVGMPALIGAAGLSVDFSQWYLWKRELQLATDQAAISAAWARTDSHTADTYQQRGTQDYHANLAITAGFASEPTFRLADYSNGNANSVVVTATATKTLPFSSFITGQGVTIGAHSQASFAAGGNYSACLIATGSTGTTLSIGGNANVTAHCGMAALSCSDNAVVIASSASVITDSIATCGTASVPSSLDGVVSDNLAKGVLTDEFADLTPPTNDTPRTYACNGNGQKAQASPLAGTYHGFTVSCKTTLGSGIYVIDGGTLDLTGNYAVTGTNVMFVLKNGATLKLGGSGNGNVLTLTPMQAADFTALGYSSTLASRYANMLIFEDKNNNPTSSQIINGNSNSLIQGTIYLPSSNAQVNGTANINSSCLQLTAQTITVLGNATIETRCPASATNSAGNAAATVRLVA